MSGVFYVYYSICRPAELNARQSLFPDASTIYMYIFSTHIYVREAHAWISHHKAIRLYWPLSFSRCLSWSSTFQMACAFSKDPDTTSFNQIFARCTQCQWMLRP